MTAISETLLSSGAPDGFVYDFDEDENEHARFRNVAIDEIERYRRMDEWISSYHNVYSATALRCKQRLAKGGVIPTSAADFFHYTRHGTFDPLRLEAFDILVERGMLRNSALLRYFLDTLHSDPSPFVRENLRRLLGRGMAAIAIGDSTPGPAAAPVDAEAGLTIEHEASATEARQADLSRTQTVPGALSAMKARLEGDKTLQEGLWAAVT